VSRCVWFNAALAALLLASVVSADEIRRWRDAEGREHVEILGADGEGDPSATETERAAADRFSTDASLRRKRIERGLVEATERWSEKRVEIREAEESKFLVQVLPTPTSKDEQERVRDLHRNALLAANAFEDEKRRRLFFLRREEREILVEIADLWHDLDRLRDEVRAYYGRAPDWWIDRVRCGSCPSLATVAETLAENEVELVTTAEPTPTAVP
jgi:hypothetical protein